MSNGDAREIRGQHTHTPLEANIVDCTIDTSSEIKQKNFADAVARVLLLRGIDKANADSWMVCKLSNAQIAQTITTASAAMWLIAERDSYIQEKGKMVLLSGALSPIAGEDMKGDTDASIN